MNRGMSEKVRLLLENAEGLDVDFKANAKVEGEDFVAFANSVDGGVLLLGVEEVTVDGVQQGRVVGCRVDDEARLVIVNKAAACIPPVTVSVDVEWAGDRAFFAVTIPSGVDKPYCTAGGTYKIRGDGRNVPLVPSNLLNLLLEREGGRFLGRFREATANLETDIGELRVKLAEVTSGALPGSGIQAATGRADDVAEQARSRVSWSARITSQGVDDDGVDRRLDRLEAGLQAIIRHLGIADRVRR